jgi:putative ABC transport system permease protein
MSDFVRDIRIGARGLRRTPTFTVAAVLILGFGIGTAVAMFTVYRAVLFERLPVRDPERVVVLSTYKDPAFEAGLVLQDLKEIDRNSRAIRDIAGYAHWGASPVPILDGDRSLILGRVLASAHFFDVLGARPALGRFFRDEDDVFGATPVMVLSYKVWQHEFGGNPQVVGRRLLEPYQQKTYTVIGVAPAGLDFPSGAGFWIPPWRTEKGPDYLSIIAVARLTPGGTPSAAAAELFSVVQRVTPQVHLTGAKAVGLPQAMFGDIRPVLVVLTIAVGLLLVIACVNVGNLLLLRAASRARELAIRRALGGTYGDVVRQLLIESGLLAVTGGALGFLTAEGLIRVLVAAAPAQLPRTDVIQLSGTPLFAAIGVTCAAVLLFGVVPALMAARTDVALTLRSDSRSGRDSKSRRRVRHVLVASQTTLALVMLAGGALLARSLARLERLNLGYNAEHLSILAASWPTLKYDSAYKLYPLGEELVRRWRSVPGVTAVTPSLIPPLLGASVFLSRLDTEGQSDAERAGNPLVPVETGGNEYFRTFGIPILKGRRFEDTDRENAQPVAIVSDAVARRLWPKENPLGKRIRFWSTDTMKLRTVIGVAGDAHMRTMRQATPAVYIPWRQADFWQFNFAIRTSGTLGAVLPAIRRELRAVDPALALWYAKPMDELLAAPLAQPRMSALLMSAFGAAALLLAAIGLYGLMASLVREQTRELGIRMALGAAPERLRRAVLGHALMISGGGALVGLVATFATSRLLGKLLFEVSPADPLALIGACVVLLTVVLAAAYVPARWATKVDPASALRAD